MPGDRCAAGPTSERTEGGRAGGLERSLEVVNVVVEGRAALAPGASVVFPSLAPWTCLVHPGLGRE